MEGNRRLQRSLGSETGCGLALALSVCPQIPGGEERSQNDFRDVVGCLSVASWPGSMALLWFSELFVSRWEGIRTQCCPRGLGWNWEMERWTGEGGVGERHRAS